MKKERQAVKEQRIYAGNLEDILTEDVSEVKTILEEILGNVPIGVDVVDDLIKVFEKRTELKKYLVEVLKSNKRFSEKYRRKFLRRIISREDEAFFFLFISELKIYQSDFEELKKARDVNIYPLFIYMMPEKLREFYRICAEKEELRRFINTNVNEMVIDIIRCNMRCKSLDGIVEFFPKLVPQVIQSLLADKKYHYFYLSYLQLAADCRYFVSGKAFYKLKKFIRENMPTILRDMYKERHNIHQAVWLFETEFNVSSNKIYAVMKELYLSDKDEIVDLNSAEYLRDYDCDGRVVEIFGDFDENAGYIDDFILTREGYDIMAKNCYELVAYYPGYVAWISEVFPHEPAALMLKIAQNPEDELINKMW